MANRLITHDAYSLKVGSIRLFIDLGAERVIAAERGNEKIAIEIKSFSGDSPVAAFHEAIGQYDNYLIALEKQKTAPPTYQPTVTVSTHRRDDGVEIRVADNGTGMPEVVKAKTFQPFFTTKPTGQGTGLGLSLAYDIITKGHGGTLSVESQEGEGTEFVVRLPA